MSNILKVYTLAAALMINSTLAQAEESIWTWLIDFNRTKEVKPVANMQYQKECGECHLAYQPGLLPSKSWEKLLTPEALKDHFGDNAELDPTTLRDIYDYAMENAADKSFYKRSRKIALATENVEALLRIVEVRYIKRKHKDIPENMVKGNKDVKSLSQCDKCHTQAAKGIFDEDTVSIPNYPDWDD